MNFNPDRYQQMTYRKCGKWGLKLPLISLGGWYTVGGYEKDNEAEKIFFAAFDTGITHFDFANNYGSPAGNGEIVGGKILKNLPRDELIISSKAGYMMWPGPYGDWGSRKYIIASCDQSLKRMGLEYFDIFYHHRPDPETPLEETFSALETLVQQGKALYVGTSKYDPDLMDQVNALTTAKKWHPVVISQPRYNLLDRNIENGLLQHAGENGYGLITFSPLAQGFLSEKYLNGIPADSRIARVNEIKKKLNQPQGGMTPPDQIKLAKIKKFNELAKRRGQSLAQMSLAWILQQPAVTSVLTAVSSLEQLEDTLKIFSHLDFNPEELNMIDQICLE